MLRRDVVLDTNALSEFLIQFFGQADRGRELFQAYNGLSEECTQRINDIVRRHIETQTLEHVVAASSLAFVELVRKWDEIVAGQIEPYQLAAFLEQSPDWFSVEPVDEDLIDVFCEVPPVVWTSDGQEFPIEWADAVHAATALSRGACWFSTTDRSLQLIPRLSDILI